LRTPRIDAGEIWRIKAVIVGKTLITNMASR
jgi:hypothetical protein